MAEVKKIATREAYGEFLVEYGAERKDLIVMSADLSGSNKTDGFEKAYPERFVESGISEQDMMAEAAGIAHSGHVVAASSFAVFAAGRAFEIVRNLIAHTNANVKICATHGGITVGEDGATHQSFEDVALMRTLPGMKVIVPADGVSTKILMRKEFDTDGPAYFRLGRSGIPVIYDENADIQIGKAMTLREGSDIAIIACGIMVDAALNAAETLKADGIEARVIDMHTIKPLDEDAIIKAASECGRLVVAEEHSVIGGLCGAVAEVTAQHHPVKIAFVGQKDCFAESGQPAELLEKYGMTANDIVKAAKGLL